MVDTPVVVPGPRTAAPPLRSSERALIPSQRPARPTAGPASIAGRPALDVAVGTAAVVARIGFGAARRAAHAFRPAASVASAVGRPLLAERRWPGSVIVRLAGEGLHQRASAAAGVSARFGALTSRVIDAVLDQLDLTDIVAKRVDLDAVASQLDVDAVVARVDLDSILKRIDVDDVVAQVDLEEIADRLPIDRILSRLDLNEIAGAIDVDAIIDRVDLLGLARYVIDGVDLPEIIRQSTGSMTSEGIRDIRIQTIHADDRVNRWVDRALLRRHARRTQAPGQRGQSDEPGSSSSAPEAEDEP